MLKVHEIREIIKLIDQTSITEFKMEEDGVKLAIKKGNSAVAYVAAEPVVAPALQAAPAPVAAPAPQAAPAPVAAPAPQAAAAPAPVADIDEAGLHKITSPMVGTFYKSAEPSAPAYVQAGSKVGNDSIVCIVEAMKLFNEIEAEVSGEIVKVLVEDGQLVEYGQPLFLVKPE
ncbi:acetyl-CoA carboxylase biotin carboxyl carrier protein [Aneurinibacillus soli]|uniref:Biotin carboxyl carrier protein of acetyl-CoA carboxylase n=1 Tax=Aneurinibacillus soli TaxID=1500254 RepID=A0A0U5B290_9BACL|nr:acetyl-CoA carboxylase biotin carboxyl carrier protein [Aneurinibacillus soli]PYE63644.1 acetyl-CoA carboxylase biotin carboxyl carrier protein [Aneurinibacillus soli]BAU27423.1 Biotin carboxyl carrier protein of acetyl-CoA carboxylase [Aneurinibacillus soli]